MGMSKNLSVSFTDIYFFQATTNCSTINYISEQVTFTLDNTTRCKITLSYQA